MILTITEGRRNFQIDPASSVCLAIPYEYNGSQPNFYNTPTGSATPFQQNNFVGEVKNNKGCNVMVINQNIHCTGTHTECASHILNQDIYIHDVLSPTFIQTKLISITPEKWTETDESYHCPVDNNDQVITKKKLIEKLHYPVDGLVLRTLPNHQGKLNRKYDSLNTAFLTTEAILYLDELNIKHLVIDLPSIDRTDDNGELGNHHHYFERVPPFEKTITELAYIPDSVDDGSYFMLIEIPAMRLDASPSRPFLFKFEEQ